MASTTRSVIPTALEYLLMIVGAVYFGVYVVVALQRIAYPFELEWMEGAMVDHVSRILHGESLYVSPSLSFVPFVYPPLYFYVSAFAAKIVGLSFIPLRLISILSSIGCYVLIYRFVRREGEYVIPGFFAAALYAATYKLCDTYFDIGRLDSFFMFLLLAGAYVLRRASSVPLLILAGILTSAAYFTKQSTSVVAIFLCIYSLVEVKGWKKLAYPITILVVVIGGTWQLNAVTDGWFGYYAFDLPSSAHLRPIGVLSFWRRDIVTPLAIAFGFAILFLAYQLRRGTREDRYFAFMFAGFMCASWLPRMMVGGWVNNDMPAYAAIAVCAGLFVQELLSHLQTTDDTSAIILAGSGKRLTMSPQSAEAVLLLFCVLQLVGLAYNPGAQIPSREDVRAGAKFIDMLTAIDGDVYIPSHGHYAAMAGKPPHVHDMGVEEIRSDKDTLKRHELEQELRDALTHRRYKAIALDGPLLLPSLEEPLRQNYYLKQRIFESDSAFWPKAGARVRPEMLYLPKQ